MTVCIGVLCDNGESAVVAADRMAVFGLGSVLEFKLDNQANKIRKLAGSSVILHSGAKQDADAVCERLAALNQNDDILRQAEEILSKLLEEKRNQHIARQVGRDFDYNKLLNSPLIMPNGPLHDVWQQARKLDLGDMLLVAPQGRTFAIYYIHPPEIIMRIDLHYAAVGSGGLYARAALTIQQYSQSARVSEALFEVYSAKKAAEIVYGVGEPTDMAILTKDGAKEVPPATISLLEQYRLERAKFLLKEDQSTRLKESLGL